VNRARGRALLVALVLLAASLGSAFASTPRATAADPQFSLLDQQPAWVNLGGDVLLRLDVPAALLPENEPVTLRLRIHQAVTSSDTFDRTVEGERLGNRIDQTYSFDLQQLYRDEQGAVLVAFGLAGSTREPALDIRAPGVYPLEVALRTDKTLASFVTWIVVADPAATVPPVRLATIWNVTSAPVLDATGAPDRKVVAELSPGGRLDDVATVLDDAGSMPLTVQVGPETLESWNTLAQSDARLAPGVGRVENAVARPTTQLLPAPYVPIDLTSLEAAGLGSQLPNQLRTGAQVLEQLTRVSPSSRTAFIDPVDAATLARVRDLLVDRVAVRAPSVANISPAGALNPFVLAAGDGTLRAVATSPQYEDLLETDVSPALRTQRLLAALSVLAFERDAPTGVVLAAPDRWEPDLATATDLIHGLAGHPYVQPVTLDDLFTTVPEATSDGVPVTHALAPHDPARFPITAARYNQVDTELAGLRSSLGPEAEDVLRGEHALDLALSTDNSTRTAEADLRVVTDAADELQRSVSTTGRRVTLTAREANVPLSFLNRTATPVSVRVHLASEKLLFPNGSDQLIVLPPGESTEQFAVEARASGTFTMTVMLTSADGNLSMGPPERVTIASAAFSGAGAALTIGALLFLALWWGNHFRRTRRARRDATAT